MQEVQTKDWFTFSQNPHTHPLLAIIKPKHPQTKKTKKKKNSLSHPQSASSHQFHHHHHHHHLLPLHHHHPIMANLSVILAASLVIAVFLSLFFFGFLSKNKITQKRDQRNSNSSFFLY
jgi:hypothetical protein